MAEGAENVPPERPKELGAEIGLADGVAVGSPDGLTPTGLEG